MWSQAQNEEDTSFPPTIHVGLKEDVHYVAMLDPEHQCFTEQRTSTEIESVCLGSLPVTGCHVSDGMNVDSTISNPVERLVSENGVKQTDCVDTHIFQEASKLLGLILDTCLQP